MNIFSDRHHSGLANSLHLTLEKRLGHNLYFPIGMEWAENNWWLIHKPYDYSIETAKQYLQIRPEYEPQDKTVSLNHVIGEKPTHYEVEDLHEGYIQKCITLEQFKRMDIDVIIASVPDHWVSFTALRDKYKPSAHVICQAGNHFLEIDSLIQTGTIKNLLASLKPFSVPTSIHSCFYHQEFDTRIFKPSTLPPKKLITSFINVYPKNGGFTDFTTLASIIPGFDFKSYGGGCPDGAISGTQTLANIIRQSYFIFQSKYGGDGYGHNLYTSMACGKPVITRISDYKGKLGEELLTDMETCIDLDVHSYNDVCYIIQDLSPDKYKFMCSQAYKRFQEKVDFDSEAQTLAAFLATLL